VLERGANKILPPDRGRDPVDLRVVAEDSFGAALQYFTEARTQRSPPGDGVTAGAEDQRVRGVPRGGLQRLGDGRRRTYTRPYGLPFVPPELRKRTPGRSRPPSRGSCPEPGIPLRISAGDLHVHTKWSERGARPRCLGRAVRARSNGYVAITDHSKGLGVAHGLTEDRVREQMGVIDAANQKLKGFRILKGIEVDIRGDGTLDLPDTPAFRAGHRGGLHPFGSGNPPRAT